MLFRSEIPTELIEWNEHSPAPTPKSFLRSSTFRPTPRATGKKTSTTMVLEVGDRVSHDTFGLGKVVSVYGEGDRAEATIDFGSNGEKRLLLRYAPVEKL